MVSDLESEKGSILGAPAEKDISLLDLLIVLLRHWKNILSITLAATIIGLVLTVLLPTRWTATTAILPPQQGTSSAGAALMSQLGSLSSLAGGAAGMGLKNPNDLQVAMLRSRTVEDAVIDRFHLKELYGKKHQSDARKKVEKWFAIESGAKDGIIRISVTDRDPNRAAEMANGYVQEFKKFSATLAVTEASQRRLFFEEQLAKAKNNLASAEEDLKRTEQQTGVIQVDTQTRATVESAAQLRAQIAAKEVTLRVLRSYETEENPEREREEQELAGLKAEQQKLGVSSDGSQNGLLIPKGMMQESSLQYVRKLREVKYHQTIFDLLARQYEAAKVDEARQGAIVQVVDVAVAPDRRSSPKLVYMLPGGAILGLLLGIAWAFSKEALSKLVENPQQRARLTTLRDLMSRRVSQRQA